MTTRRTCAALIATMLAIVIATAPRASGQADNPLPKPVTHLAWDAYVALLDSTDASASEAQYKNPSNPICSTPTSVDTNVSTDCEGVAPHNETSVAVNPTNTFNIILGANDYQLQLSPAGTTNETVYSRAHVTFDGGETWTTVPINFNGYTATGDPSLAFDASGTAYYATLGFGFGQSSPTGRNPDVLLAYSTDGGATWSTPAVVAKGTGSFGSRGTFNDKESLAAWGDGNAIVTFTDFRDGIFGSYGGSPIMATVTHDGGRTWTTPAAISGSASFCAGFSGGTACDQDQGSVPAVAADGAVYVSFLNYANDAAGRDQYLVSKVDPQTGARVGGPWRIGAVYDGFTDYPINIDDRPTYQDSEFRTWAFGAIATDPIDANHLAVAWSDMRNSVLPAPSDPYQAVTNSDVIVSQSMDGGHTWSTPVAIGGQHDQFMPWPGYGTDGKLRIGYFDRSYDSANHAYGYTLATEVTAGSLAFSTTQVTTALSDPTKDTRWFSGRTPNASFPHPTTFLGDYSGIDASQGFTVSSWTDMRLAVCVVARCGSGEDAFFAR